MVEVKSIMLATDRQEECKELSVKTWHPFFGQSFYVYFLDTKIIILVNCERS